MTTWILTAKHTCHEQGLLCKLRCVPAACLSTALSCCFSLLLLAAASAAAAACNVSKAAAWLQALQDFLEAWRTGKIKNASAYLTDLLTRASKNVGWSDQDALPFMDVPPNINPQVGGAPYLLHLCEPLLHKFSSPLL